MIYVALPETEDKIKRKDGEIQIEGAKWRKVSKVGKRQDADFIKQFAAEKAKERTIIAASSQETINN